MRILFISNDLIAGNIALLLKKEGCDVKIAIQEPQQKKNFSNLIAKTDNWRKELKWVGKDGLIIFDCVGYGEHQDRLRRKGYSVFGGSYLGDKLEADREWAQIIFNQYGLKNLKTINFKSKNELIYFLKKNKGPWVIKQNGDDPKELSYVGKFQNNVDTISMVENYFKNNPKIGVITLQKKVFGVEIGVARYFNGEDWVGPIEMNIEHKKLFPGDLGVSTPEMGTVAWYDTNEDNIFFKQTLAKLKPYLKKINYRGDFALGCMVNKTGIYPLEATCRFGVPIVHLQSEIHISPWHEFLKAIAEKKQYKLKWRSGFGVALCIVVPPFPYAKKLKGVSSFGLEVFFHPSIIKSDFKHVHFEEISLSIDKNQKQHYYISDHRGYVLYVTAMGKKISNARISALNIANKIFIPKMFYRNDIGINFENDGIYKLKKWGYQI